jgi:large subunit ribosomal protein L24
MQTIKMTTKPSKQRKMLYQAPDHVRHKLFSAPLSPELQASHGVRSLPVRSGDTVRIMRGDHKGFEGKITRVDRKKYRIFIEGLTREKVDGTTIFVPVHPSKVMITRLNLDDKWRKKTLERKKEAHKESKELLEKPSEILEIKKKPEKEELTKEKVEIQEKTLEKKPKQIKKKEAEKPKAKRRKEKVKEAEKEKKPKTKKTRAKGATPEKAAGGA